MSAVLTSAISSEDRLSIAKMLFKDWSSLPSLEFLEHSYPKRTLPEGAMVTRFAPSPTGFAHIGAVFTSLINARLSKQTGGKFLLRIEDTDARRQVDGAFDAIVKALNSYKLDPDEGFYLSADGSIQVRGDYGPYLQSDRLKIHRAHVYNLVVNGLAYPCFSSEEELTQMQELQRVQRVRPGYYGKWAKWRDADRSTIEKAIESGSSFVIRLRSFGSNDQRISWSDGVHGFVSLPENDLDVVILKSDGSSLYHLAHAVDDHWMGITDVIRGDEWISSVPLHLQIFQSFGWNPPKYTHLAPIQKLERVQVESLEGGSTNGDEKIEYKDSRRKLSKRKDPEADINYYIEQGYPIEAVNEYLLNIANSSFEDWRRANPNEPNGAFQIQISGFSSSGALVDFEKLYNIGKLVIGTMSIESVYSEALGWAKRYDEPLYLLMARYPEYTKRALNIERDGEKSSKRIGSWKDVRVHLEWFYDELFSAETAGNLMLETFAGRMDNADLIIMLAEYLKLFYPENHAGSEKRGIESHSGEATLNDLERQKTEWFDKVKTLAGNIGLAPTVKQFKKDPKAFKGHVGDLTMIVRIAVSGKTQTPDLFEVQDVMDVDRVMSRLLSVKALLEASKS